MMTYKIQTSIWRREDEGRFVLKFRTGMRSSEMAMHRHYCIRAEFINDIRKKDLGQRFRNELNISLAQIQSNSLLTKVND